MNTQDTIAVPQGLSPGHPDLLYHYDQPLIFLDRQAVPGRVRLFYAVAHIMEDPVHYRVVEMAPEAADAYADPDTNCELRAPFVGQPSMIVTWDGGPEATVLARGVTDLEGLPGAGIRWRQDPEKFRENGPILPLDDG